MRIEEMINKYIVLMFNQVLSTTFKLVRNKKSPVSTCIFSSLFAMYFL